MKYLSARARCPSCDTLSHTSYLDDPLEVGVVCYTRVWLRCTFCFYSGWAHLRQDYYDLHGQVPPGQTIEV